MALLGKLRYRARRWLALLVWRLAHPPGLRPRLALTYANGLFTDGAGAQLQRIFAIYGLSRLLGLPYHHSPICNIGYHGLAALEGQPLPRDPLEAWNNLLPLTSDAGIPEQATTVVLEKAGLGELLRLSWQARRQRRFLIVALCLPYDIADAYPRCYRAAQASLPPLPAPAQPAGDSPLRLALHVRRGDLAWFCSDRILPSSYYINVARQLTDILARRGQSFVCELHTEAPSRRLELGAGDHGVDRDQSQPVVIEPGEGDLADFDELPNLERFINGDPVDSFLRLASADILVISKSSFSYLAALLNPDAVVIYCPFLHPRLRGWLMPDASGRLDERMINKALAPLLAARAAEGKI